MVGMKGCYYKLNYLPTNFFSFGGLGEAVLIPSPLERAGAICLQSKIISL
jgi:hypothetical protein